MYYDLLLISDLRFPGGTSQAIIDELRALAKLGHRVGVLHVDGPLFKPGSRPANEKVLAAIAETGATLLRANLPISCNLCVLHNPRVFTRPLPHPLPVNAALRIMVVHHFVADHDGRFVYDPWQVDENVRAAIGGPILWAPISPVSRDLLAAQATGLPTLRLDWPPVMDASDWGRPRNRSPEEQPRIGCHGRPQQEKWPSSRDALLQVYKPDPRYQIHLLGIGDAVLGLLDHVPENWKIFPFNAIAPQAFLEMIDFFVFYPPPRSVETFGRAIAEAAAAGCIVILPENFQPTFGRAAVYAPPNRIYDLVDHYARDELAFSRQSALAHETIRTRYGLNRYREMLETLLDLRESPDSLPRLLSTDQHGALLASFWKRCRCHMQKWTDKKLREGR